MPEGKKFSHISVNAAEDDDVVIQAGSYRHHDSEPDLPAAEERNPKDAGADFVEAPAEGSYAEQAASAAAPREVPEAVDAPRDAYDQTLEDLEPTPMSKMQKYVLAGLACFVVVFVAYYVIRFVL